jgi:enoyl-CoA hydratase/carnithine racemase
MSESLPDSLLLERRDAVATLTFNRPTQRNSLPPDDWIRLGAILRDLGTDAGVRAIVLRGAGGRAFSSGYDIGALRDLDERGIVLSTPDDPFEIALAALVSCPMPTIAMVNGFAVGGGCTFAAGCDIRIAGTSARFGMPPAKLGVLYSANELQPFVDLLGPAKTKLMFFAGRIYSAEHAQRLGLVEEVVPDDELEAFVEALVAEIVANAPLSVRGTKHLLRLMRGAPAPKSAAAEIDAAIQFVNTSDDLREGIQAFLEKRSPAFVGS